MGTITDCVITVQLVASRDFMFCAFDSAHAPLREKNAKYIIFSCEICAIRRPTAVLHDHPNNGGKILRFPFETSTLNEFVFRAMAASGSLDHGLFGLNQLLECNLRKHKTNNNLWFKNGREISFERRYHHQQHSLIHRIFNCSIQWLNFIHRQFCYSFVFSFRFILSSQFVFDGVISNLF